MVQPSGFQTTMIGGFDGTALQALAVSTTGEVMIGADGTPGNTGLSTPAAVKDRAGTTRPLATGIYASNGLNWDGLRTPSLFKDINAVALVAGTGATVWTPAAGKKFRLMGGWFSSSAAAALVFGDNAVGTVIFRTPLLAAAGVFVLPPLGNGFLSAAANNVLKLDVSVNSTVTGCVFGTDE